MDSIATPEAWEIVLGIDNIVSVTVLAGRLPESEWSRARRIGLGLCGNAQPPTSGVPEGPCEAPRGVA